MPAPARVLLRPVGVALGLLLLCAAPASSQLGDGADDDRAEPAPVLASMTSVPAKMLFGHVSGPAPGPAQAIGFYALGCLSGAAQLPATDPSKPPAWQVMRPSRNRAWGHPQLVDFIERLARDAKAAGDWNGLLVGDLSQPRGGPMLNGHASHQVGLDADIWLTPMPDRILSRSERENMQARVMVKSHFDIDPQAWSDAQAKLIRRAAIAPEVQRIFVHPPIKKELCRWATGDRSWLAKVRPYFGHDYHFHIRLRCPDGSTGCRAQPESHPADGTGCGDELKVWLSASFWARHQPPAPGKPVKPAPDLKLSSLPAACRGVLGTP